MNSKHFRQSTFKPPPSALSATPELNSANFSEAFVSFYEHNSRTFFKVHPETSQTLATKQRDAVHDGNVDQYCCEAFQQFVQQQITAFIIASCTYIFKTALVVTDYTTVNDILV